MKIEFPEIKASISSNITNEEPIEITTTITSEESDIMSERSYSILKAADQVQDLISILGELSNET